MDPLTTLELPDDSIIVFDEAYREFYSRQAMSAVNKQIDTIAGLVGQKNICALYVTQLARKLDVGIVGACDSILFKQPSLLQMKFDRGEMKKEIEKIYRLFKDIPSEKVKAHTYVISDDFEGFLKNPLPPWWTEELSKAYRGIALETEPKREGELVDVAEFKKRRYLIYRDKNGETWIEEQLK